MSALRRRCTLSFVCAGYEVTADPEAIVEAFSVDDVQLDASAREQLATGVTLERFPRQQSLIVIARRNEEGVLRRILGPARFGLIPHFAKNPNEGDKHFNARSETVHERPLFRTAFERRRCLVPVSAFFEWQRLGKRSQRYTFRPRSAPFLALAGIWSTFRTPDGQKIGSFAILTTEPSALVAPIHDRMPVVLSEAAQDVWLSADADALSLRNLLHPVGDELLTVDAPVQLTMS